MARASCEEFGSVGFTDNDDGDGAVLARLASAPPPALPLACQGLMRGECEFDPRLPSAEAAAERMRPIGCIAGGGGQASESEPSSFDRSLTIRAERALSSRLKAARFRPDRGARDELGGLDGGA